MGTIKMTIEVNVDDNLFDLKNEQERLWLENEILIGDGSLILHSNEIGDTVGTLIKATNITYHT